MLKRFLYKSLLAIALPASILLFVAGTWAACAEVVNLFHYQKARAVIKQRNEAYFSSITGIYSQKDKRAPLPISTELPENIEKLMQSTVAIRSYNNADHPELFDFPEQNRSLFRTMATPVINYAMKLSSDGEENIFGLPDENDSIGAGVVIAPGRILTAAHLIHPDVSFGYLVQLADGDLRVAHLQRVSLKYDAAILTIEGATPPPVSISNQQPERGARAVAVGMPKEVLWAITTGFWRGSYTVNSARGGPTSHYATQGALYHGNSGGPVFNTAGDLVGITTFGIGDLVLTVPASAALASMDGEPAKPHCLTALW